jgi:hypothetical protein
MYQLTDEETRESRRERLLWNALGVAVVLMFSALLAFTLYGCWA